MNLNKHLN